MRWYFFFWPPPCQKKVLCLSKFSMTVFGKKYIDMWYIKVLVRLELIIVVLPAIER
jgi:hypothetical protein